LGHPDGEAYSLWLRSEVLAYISRAAEAREAAEAALGGARRIGHREWTAAALHGSGRRSWRGATWTPRKLPCPDGLEVVGRPAHLRVLGLGGYGGGAPDEGRPGRGQAICGGRPRVGHSHEQLEGTGLGLRSRWPPGTRMLPRFSETRSVGPRRPVTCSPSTACGAWAECLGLPCKGAGLSGPCGDHVASCSDAGPVSTRSRMPPPGPRSLPRAPRCGRDARPSARSR